MTEIEGFNPRIDPFLQFVTDTPVLLRIVFVDTSQNLAFKAAPSNTSRQVSFQGPSGEVAILTCAFVPSLQKQQTWPYIRKYVSPRRKRIGASLFFSGAVGVLVGFDTLCLQNRWGGHGPIPLSIAQPSLQHRQSTIEMKQNPMGEGGARSDNVVFDLHGGFLSDISSIQRNPTVGRVK